MSVVTVEPVAALSPNVIFFLVDTLRDWIYGLPTWLSGSIIVFGAVTLALLGLIIFHQFVRRNSGEPTTMLPVLFSLLWE